MQIKLLPVFILLTFTGGILRAQSQGAVYQEDSSIKVYAYGAERTLAWCGGFNNPQIQIADLNNDGLTDLVIFENYHGVRTFINVGSVGNPQYVYAPEYALNFPAITDYMILKDYNCDNIPDMFDGGGTGFSVNTGYYNSSNQLCFRFYKNLYYTNEVGNGTVNAYNSGGDIPAIVDVDNDGDLDFFAYDNSGSVIQWFKNMRVEMGAPCDSIIIELQDRCWGKIKQSGTRNHFLQFTCNETGLGHKETQLTHVGNTICLFDYDGDGDYDYLDGSISFNEMTFLLNGKVEYRHDNDTMIYQDTLWQTNGKKIDLPLWPAAFNIDVDEDGRKDLLITPNAQNTSENYRCVWYYKNESTPGTPSYIFQTDTFLVDKTIDVGSAAYPTLFDYDKDGKPDLFIGSQGYYQGSGELRSRISYYKNTSMPGNPSFTLQTDDFLGLNTNDFQGTAPAMGDLDNDGLQDMVIGQSSGTLSFFSNSAASNNVQPVWQMTQQTLRDVNDSVINVGGNAAPFIYDLNKDGKPDLLIGAFNGYITYYQNVSTIPGVVFLKFITSQLGYAKADPNNYFGGSCTPYIGKIDNTGIEYLLMGSSSGSISRYGGFQNGNIVDSFKMLDSIYSYINKNNGTMQTAPVVGDVDGDGRYEMFIGVTYGGVQLFKQGVNPAGIANVNATPGNLNMRLYPNPANDNITIALNDPLQENAQVSIVNMQGQQLISTTANAGQTTIKIQLAVLPPGMYICILETNNKKYHSRFTVLK